MAADPQSRPTILHRKSLIDAGYSDDEIRVARKSGAWRSLHRGAYWPSTLPLTVDQEYLLRVRAVGARSPHLAISHISAAALHELPVTGTELDLVHLTRVGGGGGRIGPGRVVHAAKLSSTDLTTLAGLQVTSVARTLIDTACISTFDTTVVAADAALQRQLVTAPELTSALMAIRHRSGAGPGRRALRFADGRSESVGESLTRAVIHRSGLPAPELQIQIHGPDGRFIGRTDLGYPECAVLIEFDGTVKYSKLLKPGQAPHEVVVAEKRREDRLRELGFVVLRFVWSDLADPESMVARIRRAVDLGRNVVDRGGFAGRWAVDPALGITV